MAKAVSLLEIFLFLSWNEDDAFSALSSSAVYFSGYPPRRIRKTAKGDSYLIHVCPYVSLSVQTEQLGSHRTDFHETWCFKYFSKFCP